MKTRFLRTLALTTLAVALPLSIASSASAAVHHHNPDIYNRTGSIANDWHIHFRSLEGHSLTVTKTYEVGLKPFPHANTTISGNGTADVTVNYSGAQLNIGDENHNGVDITYQDGDQVPSIVESYWTLDGSGIVGSQALPTVKVQGGGDQWVVVKAEVFSNVNGTTLLGTVFAEGKGTKATLTNEVKSLLQPATPVFARSAVMMSPTEIPLEQLNLNLGGFPQPGAITTIAPTVGLPALPPWLIVLLCLTLLGSSLVLLRRGPRRSLV